MMPVRFIKVLNYVLAGSSFFVFLLIAATFFQQPKTFISGRWLDAKKLDDALSGMSLSSVPLQPRKDADASFKVVQGRSRKLFIKPLLTEAPVVKKIARDDGAVKELRLVAVIRDDDVKVAIEDKRSGSTFLVSVNDYCGDMRVSEIHGNKVVLEKDGMFYNLAM